MNWWINARVGRWRRRRLTLTRRGYRGHCPNETDYFSTGFIPCHYARRYSPHGERYRSRAIDSVFQRGKEIAATIWIVIEIGYFHCEPAIRRPRRAQNSAIFSDIIKPTEFFFLFITKLLVRGSMSNWLESSLRDTSIVQLFPTTIRTLQLKLTKLYPRVCPDL